jgi:hypothetical protein
MKSAARVIAFAAWASSTACASSAPPAPTPPPVAPAAPLSSPRHASDYAIGEWHLGLPAGALARDTVLWSTRRYETSGPHAALLFGARHPDPADPLKGSRLVFFGQRADADETSFTPTAFVALGAHGVALVGLPPLGQQDPSFELGPVEAVVQLDAVPDEPALRVECRATNVCVVFAADAPVGYALGDVPREASAKFHKALRRLVLTHLGLR